MCGICGILRLNRGSDREEEKIHTMMDLVTHRGPDDDGFYIDENIQLGFKRLSIIDLYTGSQPIFNEDRTKLIVFNGEIYNYQELREDLLKKGHSFYTRTDTEVVVHLYEEYGDDSPKLLNGMFAYAIWDKTEQRLFLARDRLGIKPLYYMISKDTFVFASEMKSILAVDDGNPEIDAVALHHYLSLRYPPAPYTMISGINKILPGHLIVVQRGEIKGGQYWEVPVRKDNKWSLKTGQKKLLELLKGSVETRLMSDVPLGVFLSGGIDSSAVVALMSELVSDPIKTFSIGFDSGDDFQEFNYAEKVARLFKTDHHSKIIGLSDYLKELPRIIWHLDEPVADSATIPLYFVAELARKYVTVILSGEGSDELFGGYYKEFSYFHKRHLWKKKVRNLPSFFWKGFSLKAANTINGKLSRFLEFVSNPLENDFIPPESFYFTEEEKSSMYSETYTSFPRGNSSLDFIYHYLDNKGNLDFLDRKLLVDLKTWLPDDLLIKADRATMAHSVELRVPFLDHRMVEFAFSLPSHLKISNGQGKYILKKAMEGYLPEDIIYRRKMGFPVPISPWLRDGLNDVLNSLITDKDSITQKLLRYDRITKMMKAHKTGLNNYSGHLWNLFVLELWNKIFFQKIDLKDIRLT